MLESKTWNMDHRKNNSWIVDDKMIFFVIDDLNIKGNSKQSVTSNLTIKRINRNLVYN